MWVSVWGDQSPLECLVCWKLPVMADIITSYTELIKHHLLQRNGTRKYRALPATLWGEDWRWVKVSRELCYWWVDVWQKLGNIQIKKNYFNNFVETNKSPIFQSNVKCFPLKIFLLRRRFWRHWKILLFVLFLTLSCSCDGPCPLPPPSMGWTLIRVMAVFSLIFIIILTIYMMQQ